MEPFKNKEIVLFDGICNLCNWSVQFILKHDQKRTFSFAALQSDVAKEILLHYPKNISEKDSILLIKNKKIYTESTAVLLIAKRFTGLWNLLQIFWIIPKFMRDYIYRVIAKKRYKWFGKQENCMLPSPETRDRFL